MVQAALLNTTTVADDWTTPMVDVPLVLMAQGAPSRLVVDFGEHVPDNTATAATAQTVVLNARNHWRARGACGNEWVVNPAHHWTSGAAATAACIDIHNTYVDNWSVDYSTAGTITYRVRHVTTGTTANWAWNSAPWNKDTARRARTNQRLRPQLLNHRGQPSRAAERGRQFNDASPAEILALQLLRKMVEPDDFRRYLKHGFVTVRAPSGLTYQIGRRELIKVWDGGELVATLCVHLKDHCPPTDEVVMKCLIAELDEPDLWKRSNMRWLGKNRARVEARLRAV